MISYPWNKVKGEDNAKKAWERCTGEEWEDYKGEIKKKISTGMKLKIY